jgi:hypothetical protein
MTLEGTAKIEYQRQYQRDNREALLARKKERLEAQRRLIREAKNRPCADCTVTYPYYVMEFDHVRGEKKYNLNRLGKMSASWDTIKAEIAKCEVVCANCHRERTHQRGR